MNRNLRVQLALLVYLVLITGLLYMRPSNFYNKDGTLKQYGTGGGDKTVAPLWLVNSLLLIHFPLIKRISVKSDSHFVNILDKSVKLSLKLEIIIELSVIC